MWLLWSHSRNLFGRGKRCGVGSLIASVRNVGSLYLTTFLTPYPATSTSSCSVIILPHRSPAPAPGAPPVSNMFAFACASAGSFVRLSTRSAVCATRSGRFAAARPAQHVRTLATPTMAAGDHLKEGDTVPSVVFKTRERIAAMEAAGEENPFDWVDKTSEDYFKGKRVVVFSLPGYDIAPRRAALQQSYSQPRVFCV